MPKMRTNSSAKKRFRVTGSGKVVHKRAFTGHFRTKKSGSRKRRLSVGGDVGSPDARRVLKMVPYR